MQCIRCHIELNRSHRRTAQISYCNTKCQAEHRYELYIERWLNGDEDGMRGQTLISCHIRKWILKQRGEACWQCNWDIKHPDSGKCPLEIDHIDGTHTNNRPENLRLLCPNCHALTSTYKNRNKGHGRNHRRERYAKGQSY